MSKITFRADDDLVDAVEGLEASKSEVMRDALRSYLGYARSPHAVDTLDAIVADRVEAALRERDAEGADGEAPAGDDDREHEPDAARNVNLTVTVEAADGLQVEGARKTSTAAPEAERGAADPRERDERTCAQCGESVDAEHVYCPNCGEKAARRVFCECGDEVRADWSFCPHCGRRTASADALEGSGRPR